MNSLLRSTMTLLFMIYYFATQISLAHSSPTVGEEISAAAGNLTILKTKMISSWVQQSNLRGTSGILWSCIVTLIVCIYTAMHLNIPPAHVGKWRFLRHKAIWVCLALLAPEIVLLCAYRQFAEARKLVKELNELRGAQGGVKDIREKTKKVSKEPAGDARHTQQNSQPSIVDLELGEVLVVECFRNHR